MGWVIFGGCFVLEFERISTMDRLSSLIISKICYTVFLQYAIKGIKIRSYCFIFAQFIFEEKSQHPQDPRIVCNSFSLCCSILPNSAETTV